jgi:hypothetical protein
LIARLRGQLAMAELKIEALEAELRLERIKKYGPKSDAVPSGQLELLEAEPGVSDAEVAEEAQREAVAPIRAREQEAAQAASRKTDAASASAACGAGDRLHTRAVCLR